MPPGARSAGAPVEVDLAPACARRLGCRPVPGDGRRPAGRVVGPVAGRPAGRVAGRLAGRVVRLPAGGAAVRRLGSGVAGP